jgi:hypothetical protein
MGLARSGDLVIGTSGNLVIGKSGRGHLRLLFLFHRRFSFAPFASFAVDFRFLPTP